MIHSEREGKNRQIKFIPSITNTDKNLKHAYFNNSKPKFNDSIWTRTDSNSRLPAFTYKSKAGTNFTSLIIIRSICKYNIQEKICSLHSMTEQITPDIRSNVQGKWFRGCIRPRFVFCLNTIDFWPNCNFQYVGFSEEWNMIDQSKVSKTLLMWWLRKIHNIRYSVTLV